MKLINRIRGLFRPKPTLADVMAASYARSIAVMAHDLAKADDFMKEAKRHEDN